MRGRGEWQRKIPDALHICAWALTYTFVYITPPIHTHTHAHTTTNNKEGGQPKAGPVTFSGRDPLNFSEVGQDCFYPHSPAFCSPGPGPSPQPGVLPRSSKNTFLGWRDGSLNKTLVAKPDDSEFNPWAPHGRKSKQILASSPTSTHMLWHMSTLTLQIKRFFFLPTNPHS